LNEKESLKHLDNTTSEFYRRYKFFSQQQLPKVGDHVYKINSHNGQKFEECIYIVDAILTPGIVVGRRLLANGKCYGKIGCLNAYSFLKVDENQLISKLIENDHDYMKEQQNKNKEKRKKSAKIDRYNKKISVNVQEYPYKALEMFKNSKPGDVFYSCNLIRHLKRNTITIVEVENDFITYHKRWSGGHIFTLDMRNVVSFSQKFPKYLSKEKPLDDEDIATL
jgi:hypothetical protein